MLFREAIRVSSLLVVVGCGGRGATTATGEPGANDRVVATTTVEDAGSFFNEGRICGSGVAAIELGRVGALSISPDARHLAFERAAGGVELMPITGGESLRVPGDEVTLQGARWSDSGERLAYFADGLPRLIDADGSDAVAIEVDPDLLKRSPGFSMQAAEWSRDGSMVALASGGLGILADSSGSVLSVFSTTMLEIYGSPWMLSFSANGRYLAGLQVAEGDVRSLIMVDTASLETQTVDDIVHFMLAGWLSDDSAVAVWDVGVQLWLVSPDGSARSFPSWAGLPSPTEPVVALGGPGLPIYDLRDDTTRNLLPESENVQMMRWLPDGETLGYISTSNTTSGYVSLADGSKLLDTFGVAAPDGWVAVPDAKNPSSGLLTRDIYAEGPSGARFEMEYPTALSATSDLVVGWRVRWLSGGQLAFLSDDGVHIAARDGSWNEVVCPVADSLEAPQATRIDEY